MKFDVDDKNRYRLVCVKFNLNRCRFAVAAAKCLGGSLFWDTVYFSGFRTGGGAIAPIAPQIRVHDFWRYINLYVCMYARMYVPHG